ncbi:hypothetical protein KFK09_028687 [Dendrobium nobile]|uniref:Uncharacterized protein n=1 Tax=Dendrobium nobile TaxID=94219 RepID=A0A8T3A359_DENNO|nr:hypothetical protein KFK09_028687 [Dendrobium nobile]
MPNVVGLDIDVGDKIVANVVPALSGENPIDDVVFPENDLPIQTGELVLPEVDVGTSIESPLVGNKSLVPYLVMAAAVDSSLYYFNVTHGAMVVDPSSHDINAAQGVLLENQVVNCDQIDDGVVSPLLNLAKDHGEVVFDCRGGFVYLENVGACALALSHAEVEEGGEVEAVVSGALLLLVANPLYHWGLSC